MPALNPQQQAIVTWIRTGTGSANLVARAGTGKTFTLINGAVAEIVKNETNTQIALMAYNKSAAEEFKTRLERVGLMSPRVTPGTVHSFGFRMWRQLAPRVRVEGNKVRNMSDQRRNTDPVFAQLGAQIVKLVSLAKQHAVGVNSPIEDRKVWHKLVEHYGLETNGSEDDVVDAAIELYQQSAAMLYDEVDFDDMILAPLLHDVKTKQYDWVLIDEAQDTNESRRMLALKLLKPGGRLIAVGDPKQAIYGFTGADSNSLDLIKGVLNSIELPLTVTYRCPKAVVREANRLVPDLQADSSAPEGAVRSISATSKQGAWFATEAVTAEDVALCRNTKPLLEEAYKMIGAGIGCRVEGRDVGEGLIQLATRWKRAITLGQLKDHLDTYLRTEVEKWTERKNEARVQAVEDKVETLNVIIDHLLHTGATSVADLVSHIRGLFGDTPEGESPKVFTFSTIHKSKGREWERVYVLYRAQTLPSKYAKQDWQLEQEANLEYVAITRAKAELVWIN